MNQNLDILEINPNISLPIGDDELVSLVALHEKSYDQYYSSAEYDRRAKSNTNLYYGRFGANETSAISFALAGREAPTLHKNNIIFRNLNTRLTLATSRMPDIIVNPMNASKEAITWAKDLSAHFKSRFDKGAIKRLIKKGLRHNELKFIGIIKAYWSETENDYCFEIVNPDNIKLDATAVPVEEGMSSDNCQVITESIAINTRELIARYPEKADAILKAVATELEEAPAKISYKQVWFTYYVGKERREGYAEIIGDVVLVKRETPYFDYKGEDQEFGETENEVIDETTGELMQVAAPVTFNKKNNFFSYAHKPYILINYHTGEDGPLDATSITEQAGSLQKMYNARWKQISRINAASIPRPTYLNVPDDTVTNAHRDESSYYEPISIKGDLGSDVTNVNNIVTWSQAPAASPMLYQDLLNISKELDSQYATHSTTRGETIGNESGLSKSITREGDLTLADDLVDVVIERIVSEMAQWGAQFIALYYDEKRSSLNLSSDEEVNSVSVSRENINPNMAITVKASTTDERERKDAILGLANSGNTDPYTLFEELGIERPKEKAKRLLDYNKGQFNADYAELLGIEIPEPAVEPGAPAVLPEADSEPTMPF